MSTPLQRRQRIVECGAVSEFIPKPGRYEMTRIASAYVIGGIKDPTYYIRLLAGDEDYDIVFEHYDSVWPAVHIMTEGV